MRHLANRLTPWAVALGTCWQLGCASDSAGPPSPTGDDAGAQSDGASPASPDAGHDAALDGNMAARDAGDSGEDGAVSVVNKSLDGGPEAGPDGHAGVDSGPDGTVTVDSGPDGTVTVDAGSDSTLTVDAGSDGTVTMDAGSDATVAVEAGPDANAAVDAGSEGGTDVGDAGPDAAAGPVYNLALQFSDLENGGSNPWSYGEVPTVGGAFTPFTINEKSGATAAAPSLYDYNTIASGVSASGGYLIGWNGVESNPAHPAGTAFYPFILKNIGATTFLLGASGPTFTGITVMPGQTFTSPSPSNIAVARFVAPQNLTAYTIHAQFDKLQSGTGPFSTVLVVVNGTPLYSQVLSASDATASFASGPMDLPAGSTVDFMNQPVPRFDGASVSMDAQIAP